MKLYLDTSNPTCILKLDDKTYEWEAGKELAEGLHQFIYDKLRENGSTWQDLTEIIFMSGPGSFTGLRIGAAVVNTLADQLKIPLYDHLGNKHPIIIPNYGREANISLPKK
ncbi:tRNA (adenosine(37)-N6)-threonylcarbamoyltransferase complex dimerization subunit type 1 TsaB [Candidatus Saccharibacteria bacterium]|nr:tRNA (adenosine(37)-N6)-threonylcarbamoyltransferase complex dimerization subunit type 1 TsaB [Candidatus Saccharibacteria bacterium]